MKRRARKLGEGLEEKWECMVDLRDSKGVWKKGEILVEEDGGRNGKKEV